MTAAGVVFVLAVAFFLLGLAVHGPLMAFLIPAGANVCSTSMVQPSYPFYCFPVAGAAIGLGAMIWLRFALRGPYFKVMGVLLGVVLVAGASVAAYYHFLFGAQHAASTALLAGLPISPMINSTVFVQAAMRVPLIAAGAALLVATIVAVFRSGAKDLPG